jgi:protein O-mannosyl-transferase
MFKAGVFSLIFFGLLAYVNAICHPFVHDDVVFILNNPHIADLGHWYQAFKIPEASDGINTYYRPVLEVLYRLEYRIFGPHPFGFHLFNIIVHIANGLLLFCLLQKLSLPKQVAWIIALLFLIHPVQTEAVSCIAGISNLWMALGILLALNAYLNKWYTASLLCFVMAFLSKEQAVMFLPLVMVIDYSRGVRNLLSWFLIGLAACILLWLRQIVTGASLLKDIMVSPGELYLRLAAIPRVIGMDLRLILCPYDLHYYRSTDILQSNFIAWILALISILGIFYAFKRWPHERPILALGLGWFLAALFPVLNIAPLINEYSFILTAEHFLYLPLVGILILAVLAADRFLKHSKKLLLGVVISGCLLLTWYQNTFWKSEIALFERMLAFEPDFGRGHLLLAKAYYFNGRPERAEEHYEKAFLIMSNYARKATNLTAEKFYLVFLKEILFDWAQNDCAMGHWTRGLDKYKRAAAIDGKDASLYNNMAFVYLHLGDKKDAYLSLEQALRVDPSFAQARRNLDILMPDTRSSSKSSGP